MKNNDFKKMYPLNLRVSLLIILVMFILGFMFTPEIKTAKFNPEVNDIVEIRNLPEQLRRIVKPNPLNRPQLPVEAENENEVESETIEGTDFTGYENMNEPDVPFTVPDFVAYDEKPEPVNLSNIQKNTPYPEAAKKLGIQGIVFLELTIDKRGKVRDVKVVKSLYEILDKVAVEMAWKLKFKPAMQRDTPVAVKITFPYRFTLEE